MQTKSKTKKEARQAALALVADVMRAQEISVEEVTKHLRANPVRRRAVGDVVAEMRGGAVYMYVPLGKYVVAAKGVCGGRPTIYGTRMDARHVWDLLQAGHSAARIARDHKLKREAVNEVAELASEFDYERAYV